MMIDVEASAIVHSEWLCYNDIATRDRNTLK